MGERTRRQAPEEVPSQAEYRTTMMQSETGPEGRTPGLGSLRVVRAMMIALLAGLACWAAIIAVAWRLLR